MLDTHEIARELTAAGIAPAHADAITSAVRRAAEHDASGIDLNAVATKVDLAPLVTKDELKAALAPLVTRDELNAALAALELRLVKWMIGIVFAGAGLVIAALRLIG